MLKLPHNCTHLTCSKVMLKILQARLQQYVNCEFPDVHAGFGKGIGTRDQIANIHWIIKKQNKRKTQKNRKLSKMVKLFPLFQILPIFGIDFFLQFEPFEWEANGISF